MTAYGMASGCPGPTSDQPVPGGWLAAETRWAGQGRVSLLLAACCLNRASVGAVGVVGVQLLTRPCAAQSSSPHLGTM